MRITGLLWWIGLVAATLIGAGAAYALWRGGSPGAALCAGWGGAAAVLAWVGLGLYRWREVGWVRGVRASVVLVLVGAVAGGLLERVGWRDAALVVAASAGMLLTAEVCLSLVRLALGWPVPMLAVARTLIDEARRMRIVGVLVGVMALGVPLLTFLMSPEERLEYRMGVFLLWSLTLVGLVLSIATVLLTARSVSDELAKKRAFLTLTKPIGRASYLGGKLIGAAGLNLALLAAAGAGVYGFALGLRAQPAWDVEDEIAVNNRVLTARQVLPPRPAEGTDLIGLATERLKALRERAAGDEAVEAEYGRIGDPPSAARPDLWQGILEQVRSSWLSVGPNETKEFRFTGLEKVYERASTSRERIQALLAEAGMTSDREVGPYLGQLNFVIRQQQAGLFPGRTIERLVRDFELIGERDPRFIEVLTADGRLSLETAAQVYRAAYTAPVQLRFQPEASSTPDEQVLLRMVVRGVDLSPRPVSEGDPHVVNVPAYFVEADGTLTLVVHNPPRVMGQGVGQAAAADAEAVPQPTISFNKADGLVVLHEVGGFELNLVRALLILWVKLFFLACLGAVLGSLLSFPVAVLAAAVAYAASAGSASILEDAAQYSRVAIDEGSLRVALAEAWQRAGQGFAQGEYGDVVKVAIALVAGAALQVVPSLDRFNPAEQVSEGIRVPWGDVAESVWRLGLLWTLALGAGGWWLFRKKEIAGASV
ncbi:MAG: hypothetical protein AAF288_03115 [Planctomycetota bacterium]